VTRHLLVCLAWLSAVAAILGGLFEFGTTFVAAWGLVMAIALIWWGLLMALADDRGDMRTYRDEVWVRRDAEQDNLELPYRGPVRTDDIYRLLDAQSHKRHRESVSTTITTPDGSVTKYSGIGPVFDAVERTPVWPNEVGAPE
jgi:hypothetical protein